MNDGVKAQATDKRRHHSPRRVEQAAATRHAVLSAARDLFVRDGYTAATIADMARLARVSVDTIYATVGGKPALLRELVETVISGTAHAVPAEQPDYVIRVGAAATAREKITIYAQATTAIHHGMASVFLALRDERPGSGLDPFAAPRRRRFIRVLIRPVTAARTPARLMEAVLGTARRQDSEAVS